jgi:hypothetical protein
MSPYWAEGDTILSVSVKKIKANLIALLNPKILSIKTIY